MEQSNEETVRRVDFLPWEYDPDSEEGRRQHERQRALVSAGATIGTGVFIAPNAAVYCDEGLTVGDRTYIAALAYLTGDLTFGADCSVNPFAVIRGEIRMGDGVRIGAHTSILGFNHHMDNDRPVFQQGISSKGITIIGAHVNSHPDLPTHLNRWTRENNQRLALDLIADGSLQMEPLISHRVPCDEGALMFERLATSRESFFGVLLQWPAG